MRAGALRHQIRIEVRSATKDAAGEPVNSWQVFATVRAAVDRAPGSEVWASAERQARVPTVFRVRWLSGVTPAMRIVFDGRAFDILSVVDQGGRREELVITTEENVEEAVGPEGEPYVPPIVTLAASQVTVDPIDGLAAADAQAALAELAAREVDLSPVEARLDAVEDVNALQETALGALDGRLDFVETAVTTQADGLAAEIAARSAADDVLQDGIDAEAAARAAADVAINAQLVDASDVQRGFVTLLAQTFAGLKTFLAGIALQAKLTITGVAAGANALEIPSGARIYLGETASAGSATVRVNGNTVELAPAISTPGNITLTGGRVTGFQRTAEVLGAPADGAAAVAVKSIAGVALTTPGAKIHAWENVVGSEKASIDKDGKLAITGVASGSNAIEAPSGSRLSFGGARVTGTATGPVVSTGGAADGAAAVGAATDTPAAYATAGAKLHSFRNNGTEKAHVDKDGKVTVAGVASGSTALQIPAGTYLDFSGGADGSTIRRIGTTALQIMASLAFSTGLTLNANGYQGSHSAWTAANSTGWALGAGWVGHSFDASYPAATEGYVMGWKKNGALKAQLSTTGEFESLVAGAGIILKSPNGTRWRITVSDAGALVVAAA